MILLIAVTMVKGLLEIKFHENKCNHYNISNFFLAFSAGSSTEQQDRVTKEESK